MKKDYLGRISFVFFMGFSAFCLANIAFWSMKGSLVFAFISTFAGWTGYLFAHYSVEGEFIDGNEDSENETCLRAKRYFGVVLGALILVSGMAVGVHSLRNSSLDVTVLAAFMFHTGYVVAHYSATNELV